VLITSPGGHERQARIGEIKDHGSSRSFFFGNLEKEDVPLGSHLEWQDRSLGPRQIDGLGRIRLVEQAAEVASSTR
jgi:hypothetical protein